MCKSCLNFLEFPKGLRVPQGQGLVLIHVCFSELTPRLTVCNCSIKNVRERKEGRKGGRREEGRLVGFVTSLGN